MLGRQQPSRRRRLSINRRVVSDQVLAFIDYFNCTMAKPFKWTYHRKALHA